MEKIAEDKDKLKGILCSCTGKMLLKCPFDPKQSTDSTQSPSKSMACFT